jgi:hypothetical protein
MLESILPYLRCQCHAGAPMHNKGAALLRASCGTGYPVREGILDLMGDDPSEVITPFQRLMQTPLVVSIYEDLWRRAGYYLLREEIGLHRLRILDSERHRISFTFLAHNET